MSNQRKHLYEGCTFFSTTLSEDARQKALEKVLGGITERGGEVHKLFDQGRRRLAYEINGKREGHYMLLYFTAHAAQMQELWREYHLNEDLVRFLTLRTEAVPEKIAFKPLLQE